VILRALGLVCPVEGTLADPMLELYDDKESYFVATITGARTQSAEIMATSIPA